MTRKEWWSRFKTSLNEHKTEFKESILRLADEHPVFDNGDIALLGVVAIVFVLIDMVVPGSYNPSFAMVGFWSGIGAFHILAAFIRAYEWIKLR